MGDERKALNKLLLSICVFALVTVTQAAPSPTAEQNQNKPEVLKVSPSGAFRVVQTGEDYWIVATSDETQRTKMHSEELANPEEFRFSPDEKWLYVELHHGSCMSGADLYRKSDGTSGRPFQVIAPPLEDGAWAEALKQKLFAKNFADEGECAMVRFGGWSDDSGRLLLVIRGGEERRETVGRYLYCNTRAGRFELTAYLRKLNAAEAKSKSRNVEALACAEPVDPLPDEATLKARYDDADRKLNESYHKVLDGQKSDPAFVTQLKQLQRDWLKARDAGLQIYLASYPAEEKERRRLQFLADVSLIEAESDEESAAANAR